MSRSKMARFVERERVPDDVKIELQLLLSPAPTGPRQALMRKMAERYYELEPAIRAEFAMKHLFRAPQELIGKVESFARRNGLSIVRGTGLSRERNDLLSLVTIRGTVGKMNQAFGLDLRWFNAGPLRRMAPANANKPVLPPELAKHVVGILGLDRRPIMFPTKEPVDLPDDDEAKTKRLLAPAPPSAPGHITAPDLAKLYNFPPGLDGTGQKIGVILTHGGLHPSALDTYLQCLNLNPRTVNIVSVQKVTNKPSAPGDIHSFLSGGLGSSAPPIPCNTIATSNPPPSTGNKDRLRMLFTLEAILDTELLGSVANGAGQSLYLTPDDPLGIVGALQQAGTDGMDVLVLPWGFAEGGPGENWITSIDFVLSYAVLVHHMTILCASGDRGSTPSGFVDKPKLEPFFPASSQWVVACGGTTLQAPSPSGTFSEVVWNEPKVPVFGHVATGGGFSRFIERPGWQTGNSDAMRGVPDLSISAAFATGLWVWFGYDNGVAVGTSATAAVLGGLVALINQGLGNQGLGRGVGILTPLLYDPQVRATLRRISQPGNNIVNPSVSEYQATPAMTWDPCTGLGSPDGVQLLSALEKILLKLQESSVKTLKDAEALLLGT